MPFQQAVESQLTQGQSQVLGKLKSFSNYAIALPKVDLHIPKNRQVSLFDYIKKIFNAIGGRTLFEALLKNFIKKLFDSTTRYLENAILGAVANSLDKQNIKIQKGTDNKAWLNQNILPGMNLAKDQIFALIIGFIFGPPSLMADLMSKFDKRTPKWNPDNPGDQKRLLEMSSCGQMLYSMSNLPDQGVGDLEYKKIQLQKQLTTGGIVFDISCQQVVVTMPQTVLASIVPVSAVIPGTGAPQSFNPDLAINRLDNWVQTEVARQNVPDNQSDASKSFWEGFIEKLLNLITSAVMPQLDPLFLTINKAGNPVQILVDEITGVSKEIPVTVTKEMVVSSPCDIYSLGLEEMSGNKSNSGKKDQKSAFMSHLLNALLGLLLSILLSELIKQVKKLLKNVLMKKASDLAKRLINKRKAQLQALTGNAAQKAQKAAKLAKALEKLKPILELIKG